MANFLWNFSQSGHQTTTTGFPPPVLLWQLKIGVLSWCGRDSQKLVLTRRKCAWVGERVGVGVGVGGCVGGSISQFSRRRVCSDCFLRPAVVVVVVPLVLYCCWFCLKAPLWYMSDTTAHALFFSIGGCLALTLVVGCIFFFFSPFYTVPSVFVYIFRPSFFRCDDFITLCYWMKEECFFMCGTDCIITRLPSALLVCAWALIMWSSQATCRPGEKERLVFPIIIDILYSLTIL